MPARKFFFSCVFMALLACSIQAHAGSVAILKSGDIWIVNAGHDTRLTHSGHIARASQMVYFGGSVAFVGKDKNIYVITAQGNVVQVTHEKRNRAPILVSNGTEIVYASPYDDPSKANNPYGTLFVIDPSGNQQQITREEIYENVIPAWYGPHLVLAGSSGTAAGDVSDDGVWLIDTDQHTGRRVLAPTEWADFGLAQKIVFSPNRRYAALISLGAPDGYTIAILDLTRWKLDTHPWGVGSKEGKNPGYEAAQEDGVAGMLQFHGGASLVWLTDHSFLVGCETQSDGGIEPGGIFLIDRDAKEPKRWVFTKHS